jgi:hypothetical protein
MQTNATTHNQTALQREPEFGVQMDLQKSSKHSVHNREFPKEFNVKVRKIITFVIYRFFKIVNQCLQSHISSVRKIHC